MFIILVLSYFAPRTRIELALTIRGEDYFTSLYFTQLNCTPLDFTTLNSTALDFTGASLLPPSESN